MRLSREQVEPDPLSALACDACRQLVAGQFSALTTRFGYAVGLGRDPSKAVQEDLASSLGQLGERKLDATVPPVVEIKYFKPNDTLFAVAECTLATAGGHGVLVEFVISSSGTDFHATLEQISAAA